MNKRTWWIGILLLLALWATRLNALDLLPIHNDEGLHLTRAVEVWNGHPFWAISDGKIINHWLIAAFYPQNEPVFAGRIADTGRDPMPIMQKALEIMQPYPQLELIWASPRELLNIFQADELGCHIITVTNDILKKLSLVGYDLSVYSLDTVKMFHDDAKAAGYSL